jgi:hypothetical protein
LVFTRGEHLEIELTYVATVVLRTRLRVAIRLATLPDDGPTAGFVDDAGTVPW